jgi:hypothetical protein
LSPEEGGHPLLFFHGFHLFSSAIPWRETPGSYQEARFTTRSRRTNECGMALLMKRTDVETHDDWTPAPAIPDYCGLMMTFFK